MKNFGHMILYVWTKKNKNQSLLFKQTLEKDSSTMARHLAFHPTLFDHPKGPATIKSILTSGLANYQD